MTDLDIQIDVPDDDGSHSPVRVLNGGRWLPPWFKAAAVLALGILLAVVVGGYILGRSRGDSGEAAASSTAPISSAAASPTVEASLAAVQGWEQFARTGDPAMISPYFDPAGPQAVLFSAGASTVGGTPGSPESSELDFSARNLSETRSGDLTTVSLDLVVTSPTGQETFPYDFVYRGDDTLVWTVVDRRDPGDIALPPPQAVVDAAAQSWGLFTSALAIDDAEGVSAQVSDETRQLVDQLAAALDAPSPTLPPGGPVTDPVLFRDLVERARGASSSDPDRVLMTLFDADQRRALVTGQLTSWTQVDSDRVVASLVVEGRPTATVPFRPTADGWAFDLVGALQASDGGDQ